MPLTSCPDPGHKLLSYGQSSLVPQPKLADAVGRELDNGKRRRDGYAPFLSE